MSGRLMRGPRALRSMSRLPRRAASAFPARQEFPASRESFFAAPPRSRQTAGFGCPRAEFPCAEQGPNRGPRRREQGNRRARQGNPAPGAELPRRGFDGGQSTEGRWRFFGRAVAAGNRKARRERRSTREPRIAGTVRRMRHAHQRRFGSGQRAPVSSWRTIAAPSASARSLPKAVARGRYFMPQSGAATRRSAAM